MPLGVGSNHNRDQSFICEIFLNMGQSDSGERYGPYDGFFKNLFLMSHRIKANPYLAMISLEAGSGARWGFQFFIGIYRKIL